jgi:glycosyl hydrolase family 123
LPAARRALLALTLALALAPAARAATVWTALATEKLRPDAAARSDRAAAMSAAKNEFEAFQIAVVGPATNVSATATALTGPGNIAAPRLYREMLVDLQYASSADGETGSFPDALVPDVDEVVGEKRNAFPFDVPAGQTYVVYAEVHVPPSAVAGDYAGTVTIHAADGDVEVPVKLTVWNFALPSTSSLRSAFGEGGAAAQHALSGDALTALETRYAQLALDHRVSLHNVRDGANPNWSHFDQWYGPLLDGATPTQLVGARLTSMSSGADLSSAGQHSDWASHFKAKGWFDRLFQYTCDEPPITCAWSDIPARAQNAKQADPSFRTLVTTDVGDATQNGVAGSIDYMVPVINYLDDRPYDAYGWTAGGETRPQYDGFLTGAGKELWLYQSCMSDGCGGTVDMGNPSATDMYYTGWPSYMVDASAVRNRAMEWFSFRYGASGELYYETTQAYYARDPWTGGLWDFSGNGDGTLFWPGTPARIGGQTDVPLASLRLKMIREGMEDYEYLKLLSDLGGASEAQAIAKQLFPHPWQSEQQPADLMAARAQLAQRIVALSTTASSSAAVTAVTAGASATSSAAGSSAAAATPASGCSAGGGGAGLVTVLAAPLALAWRRRRP